MKKLCLVLVLVFCCALVLGSAGCGSELPKDVQTWANIAWKQYKEGSVQSEMWSVKSGAESKPFTITSAKRGTLPQYAQMELGSDYGPDVWCISFEPALYTSNEELVFQNMVLLHASNGNWFEMGQLWNELRGRQWVFQVYGSGNAPPNSYFGPTKHMFEAMGCDNFTGSDDAARVY